MFKFFYIILNIFRYFLKYITDSLRKFIIKKIPI